MCSGSFLTCLLAKLDTFLDNGLYINLQLTGVLCRLACHTQPLTASLFFNPTLVLQPSVKSIWQVSVIVVICYETFFFLCTYLCVFLCVFIFMYCFYLFCVILIVRVIADFVGHQPENRCACLCRRWLQSAVAARLEVHDHQG